MRSFTKNKTLAKISGFIVYPSTFQSIQPFCGNSDGVYQYIQELQNVADDMIKYMLHFWAASYMISLHLSRFNHSVMAGNLHI